MKHKFIFDLSEVLIAGLVGIETKLAPLILVPEGEILKYFGGQLLEEICCGTITEEVYLEKIVQGQAWDISVDALKKLIRANFHDEVRGTKTVMKQLAANHEVVLLSDHAKEWIDYIQMIHPFIGNFRQTFFSYQLGKTKKNPEIFREVLEALAWRAEECWLIDDSPQNIRVASLLGINGIQFKNANQLREELINRSIL